MTRRVVQLVLSVVLAASAAGQAMAAEKVKPKGPAKKPGPAAPIRYDVFYQVRLPVFADILAEKFEQWAQRELGPKPGEREEDVALRNLLVQNCVQAAVRTVRELDEVSAGWRVDRQEKRTFVDLRATALPGTPLASNFSQARELKTSFGGFRLPGAVFQAHWVGKAQGADAAASAKFVEQLRQKALKDIDRQGGSDDEKRIRKELANQLFDVLRDTAASGRSDGAISVLVTPKAATLIAGTYVADGMKLQDVVRKVGEFLRDHHPAFSGLKLDAETFEGVTLHTLPLPLLPLGDQETARQVLGDSPEVVLGFGKEAMYMAAGRNAVQRLKEAIGRSATPVVPPAPAEVWVALRPVAQFVAEVGPPRQQEHARKALELLDQAKGKDHLRMVVRTTDRGAMLRIEAEQGVLEIVRAVRPDIGRFFLGD